MWSFKIFSRAIILNNKKEILLIKKNNKQKYWAWNIMLPGWTVEFWEKVEDSLIREIKEETNLDIENLKIFDTKTLIIWEEHWLWVYFIASAKNLEDLKNMEPEKHDFCEFFDILKIENDFICKNIILNFYKNFKKLVK